MVGASGRWRPRVSRTPIDRSGERMRARQIRMTDAQWHKLVALGGAAWVRDKVKRAWLYEPDLITAKLKLERRRLLSLGQSTEAETEPAEDLSFGESTSPAPEVLSFAESTQPETEPRGLSVAEQAAMLRNPASRR